MSQEPVSADERGIFISYRRETSSFIARAIFENLRRSRYDVFMDVESIDSGQFDTIILHQIAARAHFLLILTPGSLQRCKDPDDWLRREIEHAIEMKRNIVPVFANNFTFQDSEPYLDGKLEDITRYNGVSLSHELFNEGMTKLRARFLKKKLRAEVIPAPTDELRIVRERIEALSQQPQPTAAELAAEQHFNEGYAKQQAGDLDSALEAYDRAIELNASYDKAYYNRGLVYYYRMNLPQAIEDYSKAIQLKPDYVKAYNNRGVAYSEQNNYPAAIADYTAALGINPEFAMLYNNRGNAYRMARDFGRAIEDYQNYLKYERSLDGDKTDEIEQIIQNIRSQNLGTSNINPAIVADELPDQKPPEIENIIAPQTGRLEKFQNDRQSLVLHVVKFDTQVMVNFDTATPGRIVRTVGRRDSNNNFVPDIDLEPFSAEEQGVSRRHLTLELNNGALLVIDENSSNGTKLNGRALQPNRPELIFNGDVLVLGNLSMEIQYIRRAT